MDALLHNSCKLYPDTCAIVESALQMDPDAIRRPIPIDCSDEKLTTIIAPTNHNNKDGGGGSSNKRRALLEQYSYPINIALKSNACTDVLKLLIEQGPDVLDKPDGPNRACSLSFAITFERPKSILEMILKANPKSARTVDRHSNTPLHVLVRSNCSDLCTFETIHMVYQAYPEALAAKNFHRESPLEVAQRVEGCPEMVVNFFQSRAFGSLDAMAEEHLDDL